MPLPAPPIPLTGVDTATGPPSMPIIWVDTPTQAKPDRTISSAV